MKKILNKILDEINKESPRLDYIRGLIEASIEEQDVYSVEIPKKVFNAPKTAREVSIEADEGAALDAKAKESLATIKALANESVTE